MKYFIKIDRNSIRKNPKWPRSIREPCCYKEDIPEETITIIDKRDNKYYKIIIFDDREVHKEQLTKLEFAEAIHQALNLRTKFKEQKMPNKIKKLLKSYTLPFLLEYEIYRNIEPIYSMSEEPRYLFAYIPTLIKCEVCNEEFYHTKLKHDCYDWERCSDTICPKCHDWDCCDLEFEDIDSIIKD